MPRGFFVGGAGSAGAAQLRPPLAARWHATCWASSLNQRRAPGAWPGQHRSENGASSGGGSFKGSWLNIVKSHFLARPLVHCAGAPCNLHDNTVQVSLQKPGGKSFRAQAISESSDLVASSLVTFEEPVPLVATVVHGFGRGSRDIGFPTANLNPEQLDSELSRLSRGVYYGFAQVRHDNSDVHQMVCNIGMRPSFADGHELSIELHILNHFTEDFYGSELKALLLGFLRPEKKFESLEALVTQINKDIDMARMELDSKAAKEHILHPLFSS